MKIIIDTHIFLWALAEPEKLNKNQTKQLQARYNTIYVSAISISELMIKASIGKLKVDFNPMEISEEAGFELLDFSASDALLLKDLPFHHKDPFDRMLISQSINNDIPIMSNDQKFTLYDCTLV